MKASSSAALLLARALNLLGKPFGINPVPRAFANAAAGDAPDRAGVFDNIYVHQGWESKESRSGVGSQVNRAAGYRQSLQKCLVELGVKTILDAPCGDLNWIMPLAQDRDFTYIGGDISSTLVSGLKAQHPELDIRVFDICADAFPPADAWHCRDCLFHLSFGDIRRALERFVEADIPYALLTTHRARLLHTNLDTTTGGFRYLDLERHPFSLPSPIVYIKDYRRGLDFPRFVGLWRKEQLREALSSWGNR